MHVGCLKGSWEIQSGVCENTRARDADLCHLQGLQLMLRVIVWKKRTKKQIDGESLNLSNNQGKKLGEIREIRGVGEDAGRMETKGKSFKRQCSKVGVLQKI